MAPSFNAAPNFQRGRWDADAIRPQNIQQTHVSLHSVELLIIFPSCLKRIKSSSPLLLGGLHTGKASMKSHNKCNRNKKRHNSISFYQVALSVSVLRVAK